MELLDYRKQIDEIDEQMVALFAKRMDVAANLALLREVADRGLAVSIRNPRSLSAETTAKLMRESGFADVRSCESLEEALSLAPDGTVVCGSLFLAGEVLQLLGALPDCSGGFTPNEMLVSTFHS